MPSRNSNPQIAVRVVVAASLLLSSACATFRPQHYTNFATPTPVPPNSVLILGFMSGFEAWDADRPVRQFALKLRSMNLPGVYVETVENQKHARRLALELVRNALDLNHNGKLEPQECSSARIILYGHSWGGAAVVRLARDLKALGVPISLTVQIDSVGTDDGVIPSNVACAANFYQEDFGLIRGQREIRAGDPQKTTILGNFKYDYRNREVPEPDLAWPVKLFGGAHMKVVYDPDVWARVEALIREEIEGSAAPASGAEIR